MKVDYKILVSIVIVIAFSAGVLSADEEASQHAYETATFAAGCYWQTEVGYMNVKGVKQTAVGFSGGHKKDPSYKEVIYTDTGHAEVVHLKYDPSEVSYEELVERFWKIHDPTQLNRQGPDVGPQYRSAIFYHNKEQKRIAEESKAKLQKSGKFKKDIVTEITPFFGFFKAEEYHQKYLQKRGLKGSAKGSMIRF